MGAVISVSISDWDKSYAVNLRAPVLLTQKFLPSMKDNGGIIVFVPSASVGPYMSAYEIFKSAQIELCSTLSEETGHSAVTCFSIVPGFVKTETCVKAVETVVASMGVSPEDLPAHIDYTNLRSLFSDIVEVFTGQYRSWQQKKLLQRQFILTDFKKQMGLSADSFLHQLEVLQSQIQDDQWDEFSSSKEMLTKLQRFYEHQKDLLAGYEQDQAQLARDTALLDSWIDILQDIITSLR